MSNAAIQARALLRDHYTRHRDPPTALYVGQEDFMEMAIEARGQPGGEFTPPCFSASGRATFRGVPVYRVDESRHMAVRP